MAEDAEVDSGGVDADNKKIHKSLFSKSQLDLQVRIIIQKATK